MTNISNKIFIAIITIFHLTGISLSHIIFRKNGTAIVQASKIAILVSIFAFSLIFYCIIINFNRHVPGPDAFIATDATNIISTFLRLMSHSKALVVFIPLWLFYRQGKLIYENFRQVNEILVKIDPELGNATIITPTVRKTCLLIIFMIAYGTSQLTYLFTKMSQIDKSWLDWSMIICMVAPQAYAILCIVHLFFSLTLLSERIKQVNKVLKDVFKWITRAKNRNCVWPWLRGAPKKFLHFYEYLLIIENMTDRCVCTVCTFFV